MTEPTAMLSLLRALHTQLRARVLDACERSSVEELARVADDGPGDTQYVVDAVSEASLLELLEAQAARVGGLVLVAEGIAGGELCLPRGADPETVAWRVLCDPIDGTRGLMYQKRSAWILSGAAPNRGSATRLSDITVAVQTEVPILKQHLCDELWAMAGEGARAERLHRFTGERRALTLCPSRATSIAQGFAMVTRFFPGARDELARIDDELIARVLGAPAPGKALCFEDQYAASGGQFYELLAGHDRFNADLRPLLGPVLEQRGLPPALCAHPYDVCTALIATELGVILESPDGSALDAPFDVHADVAWVGYANAAIRRQLAPALRDILSARGLL